jgi:diguanylate cyclase (GGDEF)-like protein
MSQRNPVDPVSFRQSLLQLLEAGPADDEKLMAEFESRMEEGYPLYSSVLEAEARRHWRNIVAHRDLLRMETGRDVGLRVALLDYFVNVNHELKNPMVIELAIYERTERSAVTDGLTGLFNHAHFTRALKREVQRAKRHNGKLALLMFDIDDFKKLNDTQGHLEGDRVLVKVAALIQEGMRDIDIASRYGGEEFAAILPDTAAAGGLLVAERIRGRIDDQFRRSRGGRVTVSGGLATFPEDATDAETLIRRADEGLYRSKAAGKNQITVVPEDRRRHRRFTASHHLTLRGVSGHEASAQTKNVSDGGVLVSLKEPVPIGSPLAIGPEGIPAEVVRVDAVPGEGYNVGVRLLDFDPPVPSPPASRA